MTVIEAAAIPTVDLAGSRAGRAAEVAAAIGEACETIGFFTIVNHGVDQALIDAVYQTSLAFFRQDREAKRKGCTEPPNRFRGYTEPADRPRPADLMEAFEIARWDCPQQMVEAGYPAEVVADFAPNVWAPTPPEMPEVWRAYFDAMGELAEHLMELMARALGLPAGWFASRFDRHCSYLSANYYPAQLVPPPPGEVRSRAHTDFGGLTVLYQDSDIGGLQVKVRGGEWCDVPVTPGGFVVNLGDLLAKWTNDRWVATEHRVVNPPRERSGEARMSIPFFHNPNLDALIEAIPTCVPPGTEPKYPPVLAGRWTEFRMSGYTGGSAVSEAPAGAAP